MERTIFFLFFFGFYLFIFSQAQSIISTPTQPHILRSFKLKPNQLNAGSCSYIVVIKTSCSSTSGAEYSAKSDLPGSKSWLRHCSTSYTKDKISLAFGDAYGYEVYAPRLVDPYSKTFERCSTHTFQIQGPCTSKICYIYLLRVGSDGWKPESVKINGPNTKAITFNYNAFLPNGVWFGFDHFNSVSVSAVSAVM